MTPRLNAVLPLLREEYFLEEGDELNEKSQAVQAHLGIMQSVIQRMAANSASSKAWCITLVSAILVIVADKGRSELALIAVIPTVLFVALDSYYLALEKSFRESYNHFVEKVYSGSIVMSDLYDVSPDGNRFMAVARALASFSIWPFYLTLLVMIWIAKALII